MKESGRGNGGHLVEGNDFSDNLQSLGDFSTRSASIGILFLIFSPAIFFLSVLMARIWLELIIVVFKIAENTSRLVDKNERGGAPLIE